MCVFVCVYVLCVFACVYIRTYVCVCICVCVYACLCLCLCLCVCSVVLYACTLHTHTCRDIVKLTAQFVARNGAQFLDKLIMREQVICKHTHVQWNLSIMDTTAWAKKNVSSLERCPYFRG